MTNGINGQNGLNQVGGVYEKITGEKPETQGLVDKIETKGIFDVAKDNGIPMGGVKDIAEKAGVPTGGAIEAVTGKEMPKMGLIHMIDQYGKGIYQTIRNWFGGNK